MAANVMRFATALRLLPRCTGADGYLSRRGVILLLGHMRCFSSLLGHLIGSHPSVAGYAEMHQKYRNSLDFVELAAKVEDAEGRPTAGRYLFDKLLHPLDLRDRILRRDDVALILMARSPEATVNSILKIGAGGITTVDGAIDYYLARMKALRDVFLRRQGRLLYLDGEQLLEDAAGTLRVLSAYLGLRSPLSEEYRLFPKTGVGKFGDVSPWIKAGRIVRQRDPQPALPLLSPRLAEARQAYRELREICRLGADLALLSSAKETAPPHPVSALPARRVG